MVPLIIMESTSPLILPRDESRGYIINIVGWTGTAISTVFVLLRLYSRLFVIRSLWWDDAIIVLSAVLNIIATALGSVSIHYGIGRHMHYIPPDDISPTLYYSALAQPIGIAAYCFPKLAVIMFIVRLMGTAKRGVWFLYAVIAILFIVSTVAFVLLFLQCNPPDHLWHPFSPANCLPPYVLVNATYVAGSWSAFTDGVLAVFPITFLWNLQLQRSRKVSIMLVMGLGFFAMIAAIVKSTQLYSHSSADSTWELFGLFLTAFIETNIVIIAACAPALPKLVLKVWGKGGESSSRELHPSRVMPASHSYKVFGQNSNSIRMKPVEFEVRETF
ncbi:hypothetical protein F4802DRAFT_583700 [Xylaria palmicola]|nr:hypothetical protein F4802DRAFT_583700 [Xylaria palmicola]